MQPRLRTPAAMTWAAIALLILIGGIHLFEAPDQFGDAPYKGLLFLASAAGCAVALAGIRRSERWGWALGALIALTTAAGYVWSRTVGLPGLPVDPNLFEPLGVVSVAAEMLFLGLTAALLSRRSESVPAPRRFVRDEAA